MRLWWALFIRTGLTPRIAKRLLTAKEAQELAIYDQRYPIDDQSNFHLPPAQLAQIYVNSHRGEGDAPYRTSDFMAFYEPPAVVDLDDKFRAILSKVPKEE